MEFGEIRRPGADSQFPMTPESPKPMGPGSSCSSIQLDADEDDSNSHVADFIPVGVIWRQPPVTSNSLPDLEMHSLKDLESAKLIKFSIKCEAPNRSAVRISVACEDRPLYLEPKRKQRLRNAMKDMMSRLDTSPEAWAGTPNRAEKTNFVGESLFYIFNTLESPKPETSHISDPWALAAMTDILYSGDEDTGNGGIPGLRTTLYQYQRQSAAFMIQKEVQPGESIDPRLQAFCGPTGQTYYYDREEGIVLKTPTMYSNISGGILAETMGFGKTLICLAVILATRGHTPSIPSEYICNSLPVRESTGTLMEMAAATAGAHSVPWAWHFNRLEADGVHYAKCIEACNENRGSYIIDRTPRFKRRCSASFRECSARVYLSAATLVIVPHNLVDQWLSEISKHTEGLRVLTLRTSQDETPSATDLLQYDIVLFSQHRFKKEFGPLSAASSSTYHSPLKQLHWLRLIVDEGHSFASSREKTSSVYMLDQLQVERRWIVSGTPSKGLYGIEISLATENVNDGSSENDTASSILQSRKDPRSILKEEFKNLDHLRGMIVDFLGLKPWANSKSADPANWTKYMKPVGLDGRRTMSPSLRTTLQSVVVRHLDKDVKREVTLPKLHNEVIYLEPSDFDKASLNIFILQLVVNAVTSERTDEDFMFHPKNRKYLTLLITNLRTAGFWFVNHEREEIQKTIDLAKEYLQKNIFRMSTLDVTLLHEGISIGEKILGCDSWNSLCRYNELGILVDKFPAHAQGFWAIEKSTEQQRPLLLGLGVARAAQRSVTRNICLSDPGKDLVEAGLKSKHEKYEATEMKDQPSKERINNGSKHPRRSKSDKTQIKHQTKSLPSDSYLNATKIVATTSAKLTYLLNRVLQFQQFEKIIIFYDNENSAASIAEGIDVLGIDYRWYASTLKQSEKSEYLSVFNEGQAVRVLLMDLRQAAHGLHIACASRVFIVSPIWDPTIESQAIKRAHRISQTRPVFVETLVLKDTLEDRMLKRRKQMNSEEMQHAEKDMLNDVTLSHIIQAESFLPLLDDPGFPTPAYFEQPLGFFNRHTLSVADNHLDDSDCLPGTESIEPSQYLSTDPVTPEERRLSYSPEADPFTTPTRRRSPKKNRQSPRQEDFFVRNGLIYASSKLRSPRK